MPVMMIVMIAMLNWMIDSDVDLLFMAWLKGWLFGECYTLLYCWLVSILVLVSDISKFLVPNLK